MFKKLERTPAENRKLMKIQITLDIIAIILLLSALIYAVGHVKEIVAAQYDYCYLCEQDEDVDCFRAGENIIWEDEEVPTSTPNFNIPYELPLEDHTE